MQSYLQLLPKGVDDYLSKFVHKINTKVELKYVLDSGEEAEGVDECFYDFTLIIEYGEIKYELNPGFGTIIDLQDTVTEIEKSLKKLESRYCRINLNISEPQKEAEEVDLIKRCDKFTNFGPKYYITSWCDNLIITEEIFNKVIEAYRGTMSNIIKNKIQKYNE